MNLYWVGLKEGKPTLSRINYFNGKGFNSFEEASKEMTKLCVEFEKTHAIYEVS